MIIKLVFSMLSLLAIILIPIFFYIYNKKISKIKFNFWGFLIGVVTCFLCKDILLKIIVNLLLINPLLNKIMINSIYSIIITSIISSLILVLGFYLINKFYYRNEMSVEDAVAIVLGMIFAEAIMNYIMPIISNLIYIVQINNGTLYDNLIKSLSAEQADTVIKLYSNFNIDYFSYFGLAYIFTFCGYYLTVKLLSRIKKQKNNYVVFVTIFILLIAENIVIYSTNPLINNNSILFICLAIITLLVFLKKMQFVRNEEI